MAKYRSQSGFGGVFCRGVVVDRVLLVLPEAWLCADVNVREGFALRELDAIARAQDEEFEEERRCGAS